VEYIRIQALGKGADIEVSDLDGSLRAWFDAFEPQAMLRQYEHLRCVAKLTQEKFPKRES